MKQGGGDNSYWNGLQNTIVISDMSIQVELALDKLVVVTLEFGAQDTLGINMDVDGMVAETLASPREVAILVPNVIVEREGRMRVVLPVRFLALGREDALCNADFFAGLRQRHSVVYQRV